MRCFDPLLRFQKRTALASTINEDLVLQMKQSLASLHKRLEPGAKFLEKTTKKSKGATTKKDKTQGACAEVMAELS